MNQSCKCDNCGEPADDECPIDTWKGEKLGCGWELCMECREKVLKEKIPCCPNCGNLKWPDYVFGENTDTQERGAKQFEEEVEQTIQKNNDSNPV